MGVWLGITFVGDQLVSAQSSIMLRALYTMIIKIGRVVIYVGRKALLSGHLQAFTWLPELCMAILCPRPSNVWQDTAGLHPRQVSLGYRLMMDQLVV